MRTIGIALAVICILLGLWTASLPNASQKLPGFLLVGYGISIIILIFLGKGEMVKKMLICTAVLLIIVYSLPMSFWAFLGLRG